MGGGPRGVPVVIERGPLVARILHALAVGAGVIVTHYLTRDPAIVASAAIGTSAIVGELIGRKLPPPVRRRRPKSPMLSELELVRSLIEQLDRLQVSMDDEINQGVEILAVMRGELQLVFMAWRGRLQSYYQYIESRTR